MKPVIVQVVGFQNSGKTTFVKKLLQELSKHKINVATIKHHGHGGKPDVVEKKDSSEHIHSGAFASLVEGEGRLLLQVEKDKWNVQEQIHILCTMNPEVILIEGHKNETYDKIVLLRNKEDFDALKSLENVMAFVSCEPIHINTSVPIWNKNETISLLVQYINEKRN
ncbi:molybdopterin-guanine dinucleotide biosynthesis protein B [Robertmurraya korlensis]|uniref:molybdopterin-guanine dinucleotide biosynthesis protein B n=1 Tax=Robertmurraya korlensis TaxID=519977 RepID=UPI00203E8DE0|nr:molybdopterin-guanine dinucleotide biosynthesis protein B [Robertmurraya korlensis]